jgi:hypothetical protein
MHPLLALALIVITGFGLFGLTWWFERFTRKPGLSAFLGGGLLLVGAAASLSTGQRLLPAVFVLQAAALFYFSYWKRSTANPQQNDM